MGLVSFALRKVGSSNMTSNKIAAGVFVCGALRRKHDTAAFPITGANACGSRLLAMRTRWAARVDQFWR
jgi:hypothetical protein